MCVDRSSSKRVPVSGTGRDPLMDPMKSHQIFLLGALPGFQVSKLGWILTVKKAPAASWVSSSHNPCTRPVQPPYTGMWDRCRMCFTCGGLDSSHLET